MAFDLAGSFHKLGENRAGAYTAELDKGHLQEIRKEMGLETKSQGVRPEDPATYKF
ncbi:MAG: hypothetical protein K9G62_09105 [Alphaproteobacteria bacterium]|nr:hypothetical protein [Alphaproteobacteria bacterium]